MWGHTEWSLPVVAARGECADVAHALGRTDLWSCDIAGSHRGVLNEGPCEHARRFDGGFNPCQRGYCRPRCGVA